MSELPATASTHRLRSTPTGTGVETYGVFFLGSAEIAILLSMMREVLCPPAEFVRLPVAAPGLLGAMDLRGVVVPVFDLGQRLGLTASAAEHNAIVIASDGRRVLGIRVEQLGRVCEVASQDLMPVTSTRPDLLISHTFRHPEGGGVTSVLDLWQVLDLPDLFSTTHIGYGSGLSTGNAHLDESDERQTLTLIRCGSYVLGLNIVDVHTTLPDCSARPSILTSPLCPGVLDYRGSEVAVLDPLVLLGLGQLRDDQRGPGVVLEVEGGFVVLAVTELISLAPTAHSAILPVPTVALERADLVCGIVSTESNGDVLVLDGTAVRAEPDVVALASMNVAKDAGRLTVGTAENSSVRRDAGPAHLSYSIGVRVVTPLDQISEILPYPATLIALTETGRVRGIMSHREATVPIICLATVLGRAAGPITSETCVLLMTSENGHVGFVVDSLIGIDALTWSEDRSAGGFTDASRALQSSPLVRVGEGDKLIPQLDLQSLTHLLLHDPHSDLGAQQEDASSRAA